MSSENTIKVGYSTKESLMFDEALANFFKASRIPAFAGMTVAKNFANALARIARYALHPGYSADIKKPRNISASRLLCFT